MERRVLKRRRPALSCISCRRRKIKCDRNSPCGQCVAISTQCAFQQFDNQVSSPAPSPRPRSQFVLATPPSQASQEEAQAAAAEIGHIAGPLGVPSPHRAGESVTEARVESHEEPQRTYSVADSLAETGRNLLARQTGPGSTDVVLNKTRILRWSNWVGAAKEFRTIGACYAEAHGGGTSTAFQAEETKELTNEIGVLLTKIKAVARSCKASRPTRLTASIELPAPPSRDAAEKMARLYFDSFEACFRIVHAPSFWKEFDTFWDQPQSMKLEQRLIILIVIGLGSSLCTAEERGRDGLEEKVYHWIYASETWLSGPLEKDRLTIAGIQLQCLLILARQAFSIGGDLVWTSVGSLVHRAMQIGLHRDPKHLQGMSILEAELRRRLWATILELAVQASLDSAMPPRISLDEFDTEAPLNIDDADLDNSLGTIEPRTGFASTSVQRALLESFPTRLRVVQRLNSLRSALTYSDTLKLSEEIMGVCRANTQFMKTYSNDGMTSFHRNMLDYLVRRLLIPLHCSFANEARTNPVFYSSLKTNLDTAISIMSPEPDEGYTQLMLIGGGMFREGIRYANTVIGLEIIAEAEAQGQISGFRGGGSTAYIDYLKKLVHIMMDLAAKRVAHGESNVKSHMFMKMILAQVSCIERGVPCEHEVALGARDSLQSCYDVLRERAGTFPLPSPSVGVADIDWNDQWAGFDLGFFLYDGESF